MEIRLVLRPENTLVAPLLWELHTYVLYSEQIECRSNLSHLILLPCDALYSWRKVVPDCD